MAEHGAVGSLSELAKMPGSYSEPVLRKLIRDHPDFPVIDGGARGRAYKIEIPAAMDWIKAHRDRKLEAERDRAAEVQRYSVDLLGDDAAADVARSGMSSAERRELYEEEMAAIKLGALRGEFVRKASVEVAMTILIEKVSQRFRGIPAKLAKRTDLNRQQRALIADVVKAELNQLAAEFEEMERHAGSVGDPPV